MRPHEIGPLAAPLRLPRALAGSVAGALALLALSMGPTAAVAQPAPQHAMVPAEKPTTQPQATAEPVGADAAAPEPAEKPTGEAAVQSGPAPANAPPVPQEPPRPQQLAESDLDLGICLGRLAAFGTVFERGRPVSEEGGACGIANPVRVTEIVPGVALSPPAIMRCATAAALAEWVARFALPASAMLPGRGRLTEVRQGSAYICRPVDNAAGRDLSEHAFGNAIDVMGFRFSSGAPIAVEPREREGTPAEAFQRTVRAAACLGFTTVLGPGEAEHDDHLHLDIKARDGGFRLCE